MTGVHSCDYSDASGMLLLDVKNKCWSKEMMEICDVKEEQLPKLFESYEVTGSLTKDAAAALGLTTNCKIAAGAGDNAAAAVGTGTVGDGGCNISLGTSGTIFISSKEFGVDRFNALHSFDHADGNFHLMGCMLSAASCNKWWMDEIIGTKDYGKEQEPITEDKLGENNVYYLPYLMGERSPHNNPDARALFIGMSMDTTRADMTQAVLEGVAFAMRDCYEIAKDLGINITETKICGGGAKSPLWRKIMANVLNINVNIIESEEGPGLGGAMLAAVACGEYASVQEAADKIVKVIGTEKPDPALAAKYDKKYAKFKEIYPTVKGLYDTGNCLLDTQTGKPVCVMEYSSFEGLLDREQREALEHFCAMNLEEGKEQMGKGLEELQPRFVLYTSVGCQRGLLPVVTAESMTVYTEDGEKEIWGAPIGLSRTSLSLDRRFQMIINPGILKS